MHPPLERREGGEVGERCDDEGCRNERIVSRSLHGYECSERHIPLLLDAAVQPALMRCFDVRAHVARLEGVQG